MRQLGDTTHAIGGHTVGLSQLAGWEVQRTWADALNFTYFITTDAQVLGEDKRIEDLSRQAAAYTSGGIRVFIKVARVSRSALDSAVGLQFRDAPLLHSEMPNTEDRTSWTAILAIHKKRACR